MGKNHPKGKCDNAGEREEIGGAGSSNGQEEIRPSARIEELASAGVHPGETGIDVGRRLYLEMGVCGSDHLSLYIFLVPRDASSWAQSKCGNLRRDKKV